MLPPSRLDKFSLYEMLGARLFGQEKHKQVHRKGNFSQIFRSRNINNSISEHNFQRNPNQFKLAWLKPHIDSINDKNYISNSITLNSIKRKTSIYLLFQEKIDMGVMILRK